MFRRTNSVIDEDESMQFQEKFPSEKTKEDKRISPSFFQTEISSSSSLATSNSIEELPLSPPEYLNFHNESECVDEFFLFSEDVLNMDFDTVCEDLARFSKDMEKVLKQRKENLSFLKAAKASDEWKTLWIYRGRGNIIKMTTPKQNAF